VYKTQFSKFRSVYKKGSSGQKPVFTGTIKGKKMSGTTPAGRLRTAIHQ
jgi:hypothetical protein